MRGEHIPYQIGYRLEVGSSPHARGTLEAGAAHGWNLGIIPACAGNTSAIHGRANGARDHPRMRGEHIGEIFQFRSRRGSSPHARGTRIGNAINEPRNGIIPACAGNTRHLTVFCKLTWDHPRMRGEHPLRRTLSRIVAGSSPHARGTLELVSSVGCSPGIIPACAGNTVQCDRPHRDLRDHPRMRGEHDCSSTPNTHRRGSSPHARGTLIRRDARRWRGGIIPACAGNTIPCRILLPPSRDHPRMRGEHTMKSADSRRSLYHHSSFLFTFLFLEASMASQLRLWSEQELQAQIGYKQQAFTSAGNPPDCGRSRLQSRPLPIVYLHAVWAVQQEQVKITHQYRMTDAKASNGQA